MKEIVFPYGGSGGKGDTWEGKITVQLSESEYTRIVDSIKSGFMDMRDDDHIEDIYLRIYEMIVDGTLEDARKCDMLEEYKEYYPECDTDRDVIEAYLDDQCCCINYPEDLQNKVIR